MKKQEKVRIVDDIKAKFQRAGATFVVDYKGMKAVDLTEIRKGLRDASVDFKVVRNTLAKRAISGTPLESISDKLVGTSAIAFAYKDAAAAAKLLTQYAGERPNLKLVMGTLGNRQIGLAEIKGLAELPSRDVLLARLLGSMQSPTSGFVRVLSGVPQKFLYALNAIKDAKAGAA
ncbi:MAG: 50S ribosomal protein L10 [Deltaproteobacteria bacterium]|nr:50S ribosomal protein L10 [Deltaproteobacteria bacterium]